ncbi:MAG TPA: nucleotidyltransferase family protein [Vicinamibacterales bacterium]|nr:nucleotidyltransferase family protein [Vicinamibacterales bacterium]
MSLDDRQTVLTAVLRRVPGAWHQPAARDVAALVRAAERHGVRPLLAARATDDPDVPPALRAALTDGAPARVAADLADEAALGAAIAGLAGSGIDALLFKGSELAFTHYERSDLRPRLDADVLVRPADVEHAHQVLVDLGYIPDIQAGTEGVLHQRPYSRLTMGGQPVVIDLHWRLVNPAVFEHLGEFGELHAASIAVPLLGPHARGLGPLHAMLVACVHRVAHHFDDDRLIWLYDLHLLAGSFDEDLWRRFAIEAEARGVSAVCRASLTRAVTAFGTAVPDTVLSAPGRREVTARYLQTRRPHAQVVFDDLRALPTWRARWRTMRAHVLPPAAYMREVYAPESGKPLPWLYALRAVRGARKWFGGSSRT